MSIIQRLNTITALPTLPEVAIKVQQLIFSDDGCAATLSKIVEQDQSLTAVILRVANSGFYGPASRISSIPLAITRLGFNEVGHIVIASSMVNKLSLKAHYLNYKQFWKHSLTAAYMAEAAASISNTGIGADKRQSLYLAGLLHDIGILLYDQFFHEEFKEILDYAAKNEVSYLEAERAVAPKDTHAALGAALLEMWKLSPDVINGVRFHHAPEKAADKQKSIPFAIHLSEYILCNSGIGSFEGLIHRQGGSILSELSIDADSMPGYLAKAQNEVDKSDLILAMGGAEPEAGQNAGELLRTI